MKTIYALATSLIFAHGAEMKAQLSTTLTPVQDAYFITMGGGQGTNTMLKFDISSLPAGANITSATLQVYVWDTVGPQPFNTTATLGNMRFMNLHGHQGWTEADSAKFFYPFQNTFSDTVMQLTGFGNTIGWTSSMNLKAIVDEDHSQLNQFCTVFMKDTDDVTIFSGPSTFLTNSPDSLITGNKPVGSDQIMFYPREKANYMPKLTIIYMCPVDVSVQTSGNTITANEANGTYQWLDCNNGKAAIPGETNQSYTAMASGTYAVIVSKAGCVDTSSCTNIVFTNISSPAASSVSVYPNPAQSTLHVDCGNKTVQLMLSDVLGRVIYENNICAGKITLNLSEENKGVYTLKTISEGKVIFTKIIKE